MTKEKEQFIVDTRLSAEPEIGRWLWALQDARQRTHEKLAEVPAAAVDWMPPHGDSSIGTVLYHMALIEADWLYAEVLEQDYPASVNVLLPHEHRDAHGHLSKTEGTSLAAHLERLATIRGLLLEVYQPMTLADFRRPRPLPGYDVTPEWVLHHLMQHEAEHRSQIDALRVAAGRDQPQI